MAIKFTGSVDTSPWAAPSQEYLNKLTLDRQEFIKQSSKKAEVARTEALKKLNANIEKQEIGQQGTLEARQREIDQNLKEIYSRPTPIPEIIEGDSGRVAIKHKNMTAFIFVGDTEKSDKQIDGINAPKMAFVVGGGIETSTAKLDPRKDSILGVSSEIHLTSLSDINVDGIFGKTTLLSNRAAIKTNTDILELAARETVIIRSLGASYNSKGVRVLTPGGVHIISGQSTAEKKINEPEPMVLGKALTDTLQEFVIKISEMNSIMINMNEDILNLKIALLAHFHTIAPPGIAVPSADLAISILPTLISETALNIMNGYSNLINLEVLKVNKLTAFSAGKFLSEFNRVN